MTPEARLEFQQLFWAVRAPAVKKEFDGIRALFGEYQTALKNVYAVPAVPDPK